MIRNRLHETTYLNPELKIHYINERSGEETEVLYHEPEGICAYVKKLNDGKHVLHDPVYYKREINGIEAEIAFQYTEDFGENILGSAITFIPRRAVPISQDLSPNLQQ